MIMIKYIWVFKQDKNNPTVIPTNKKMQVNEKKCWKFITTGSDYSTIKSTMSQITLTTACAKE